MSKDDYILVPRISVIYKSAYIQRTHDTISVFFAAQCAAFHGICIRISQTICNSTHASRYPLIIPKCCIRDVAQQCVGSARDLLGATRMCEFVLSWLVLVLGNLFWVLPGLPLRWNPFVGAPGDLADSLRPAQNLGTCLSTV